MPIGVYKRSKETIHRLKTMNIGRKQTPTHIMNRTFSGSDNGNYRGDNALREALHARIRKYNPPPKHCTSCGLVKKLDLANMTGIYNGDFKNYRYLCRSCHKFFDCARK